MWIDPDSFITSKDASWTSSGSTSEDQDCSRARRTERSKLMVKEWLSESSAPKLKVNVKVSGETWSSKGPPFRSRLNFQINYTVLNRKGMTQDTACQAPISSLTIAALENGTIDPRLLVLNTSQGLQTPPCQSVINLAALLDTAAIFHDQPNFHLFIQ